MKIETQLAQIGNRSDARTGAVSTPLYFSTAYGHPGVGESTGYDYTRTANPTRDVLQQALAELEGGIAGFATSSGMSAIQLIISIFPQGSHFITSRDLYGGSFRYFNDLEDKGLYSFTYIDDPSSFESAITEKTVAFFIETPTNPLMKETSIQEVSTLAKKHQLYTIVDNTFYTPVLQKPLTEGADVVVHSATKYLGGHNDLIAGAVITSDPHIAEKLTFQLNTTGTGLPAFDCWLLIRGLKTLALRMKQHTKNATALAEFLTNDPRIAQVYYPGKGGMLSFTVKDVAMIKPLLERLNIFTFAESLGGVESLITYPTTQTHADVPRDVRYSYGLTDELLRISVGIEASEDLVADIKQALESI